MPLPASRSPERVDGGCRSSTDARTVASTVGAVASLELRRHCFSEASTLSKNWFMRCCSRSFSNTSASPTITRVMPGFFSANWISMATMRPAWPWPAGSRSAIWLIRVKTLCSMNSMRPSNICALLAKCRYSAASLTSSRAARAAVVMRSEPGCSSIVASACRICTRRSPGFGRFRTTAGAEASAPGTGSGVSSSAWDIGSADQRFNPFSHTQPWLFPNPTAGGPRREP